MNSENFKKINEEFFKHCIDTLNKKQIEYSEGKSVFHVFDQGAYKRRCMREDIIDAFMFKHELSIDSIQEDFKINKFTDIDTINEKFGDIINYLLIKRASFIDRVNKENCNKEKNEKYTYNKKGEKTSNNILDEKGNVITKIKKKSTMNICEYIIENNLPHKVLDDGRIEQVGDYEISGKGITCLKNFVQNGYLDLCSNEITSLKGFIQNGYLDVSYNKITSLEEFVQNGYILNVRNNKITSLENFVQNGYLDVRDNKIKSTEGFVRNESFPFYI